MTCVADNPFSVAALEHAVLDAQGIAPPTWELHYAVSDQWSKVYAWDSAAERAAWLALSPSWAPIHSMLGLAQALERSSGFRFMGTNSPSRRYPVERARLDASRTASPRTRLVAHARIDQTVHTHLQPDALEDVVTGARTPLASVPRRECPSGCTADEASESPPPTPASPPPPGPRPASRPRASEAVDRALKKNVASASYDTDALEIARVLVRHFGDEAEAIVDRLPACLVHARLKNGRK